MTLEERLVYWGRLRTRIRNLRSNRAAICCERAETVLGATQEQPCWKAIGNDEDGHGVYRPRAEWCASCQRRQAVSDELRQLTRHHGGIFRGLLRTAAVLAKQEEQH